MADLDHAHTFPFKRRPKLPSLSLSARHGAARSDDSDAELQQLTQKLDPLVFGRDLATLDARFVPRGPETTGFEVEPRASSFYGALPA